jgi:hypothetical protein
MWKKWGAKTSERLGVSDLSQTQRRRKSASEIFFIVISVLNLGTIFLPELKKNQNPNINHS